MPNIRASTAERIYPIQKWLGLNQAQDGKTRLKMGEASEMVNFRVTPDGVLKKRPGIRRVKRFTGKITGMWHGYVNGMEHTVVATNSGKLYDMDLEHNTESLIGEISHADGTTFFGFDNKLYILSGLFYMVWDGTTLSDVADSAYAPVVLSETPPAGGGTELEGINILSPWRRVWYSPNGSATTFKLPEAATAVVVTDRATGNPVSGVTFNSGESTVQISPAPASGTDTLEIKYRVADHEIPYSFKTMQFAELYNGANDARVFLYGNGTNQAVYSGINGDTGLPDASYFPELNVISIGDANTPITQMIRHFSRLLVFKTDSAYSIYYGQLSDAQGRLIPAFYWNPVNKAVGNVAPGQVCLVENNPITLFGSSAYHWRNTGGYSTNLTIDERQAKRISDRVWRELESMDLSKARCFDDNEHKEWYCVCGSRAAVYNYGVDAWYLYDNFKVTDMLIVDGRLYGAVYANLVEVTSEARSDLGAPIVARWASGYMSFGTDYQRKYSAMLWIAMEPMVNGEVNVTIETDRKAEYTKKVVARNRASFERMNFNKFSFKTSSRPYVTRLKIKAKKYTYYRLILTNESDASSCAVTAADVRVRYTGYVR